MVENMFITLCSCQHGPQDLPEDDLPVTSKSLWVPSMLLPSAGIYGFDAIVHTIDAQLTGPHAHNTAVLYMGSICDCIVAFSIALVCDPQIAKYRNRPVC